MGEFSIGYLSKRKLYVVPGINADSLTHRRAPQCVGPASL